MADPAFVDGAIIRGIGWPWNAGGPQGSTDIDLVKAKIGLVLFTFLGAHKMEPTFGSNLIQLTFENRGPALAIAAEIEIRNTFSRWLPDVRVQRIKVTESGQVEGLVTIDVDYEYLGQNGTWTGEVDSGSGGT